VEIVSTEIVGLVPEKALDRDTEYFQKLEKFSEDKVFEHRLRICNQVGDV
jgi:glutamate formiminotransferase